MKERERFFILFLFLRSSSRSWFADVRKQGENQLYLPSSVAGVSYSTGVCIPQESSISSWFHHQTVALSKMQLMKKKKNVPGIMPGTVGVFSDLFLDSLWVRSMVDLFLLQICFMNMGWSVFFQICFFFSRSVLCFMNRRWFGDVSSVIWLSWCFSIYGFHDVSAVIWWNNPWSIDLFLLSSCFCFDLHVSVSDFFDLHVSFSGFHDV